MASCLTFSFSAYKYLKLPLTNCSPQNTHSAINYVQIVEIQLFKMHFSLAGFARCKVMCTFFFSVKPFHNAHHQIYRPVQILDADLNRKEKWTCLCFKYCKIRPYFQEENSAFDRRQCFNPRGNRAREFKSRTPRPLLGAFLSFTMLSIILSFIKCE